MDKRIEVSFAFRNKLYNAYVLIKNHTEGITCIVNLFDKELESEFPASYTFIANDHKFISARPGSKERLHLADAIKDAIRQHLDETYAFTDFKMDLVYR